MDTANIRAAIANLSTEDYNNLITAVKADRLIADNKAGPLSDGTRIRMNADVRPTRIAGRTAVIVSTTRNRAGAWAYKAKFDGSDEIFVGLTTNSFAHHLGAPIAAASSNRRHPRQY